MAKRRRVGNLLALAVLSALLTRPMHPYEMASVLRARGKDRDMPIKWGSLYTVVGNLERHGLVEAVGTSRQGARPERTAYRITAAGRDELEDWVRELVSTPETEQSRFKAGLSVLSVLAPGEAARLLRRRVERLGERITAGRAALAEDAREVPRLFLIESEYDLTLAEAEAAWARALLDELTAGSLPGLDQWRAWHATGEIPAELAELDERGQAHE
jgi:DNA-binding PadR family transcriptional regulator